MPSFKIREAVDIPRSTWYDIMKKPDAITIEQLLAIANGLHVPVRRFFYTEENNGFGHRDDYIINNYQNCYYDAVALKDFVRNRPDVTWQKGAKATGMSYQHLQKSLLSETRLPVARLLTFCETFETDPFTIIIDPNHNEDQEITAHTVSESISEIQLNTYLIVNLDRVLYISKSNIGKIASIPKSTWYDILKKPYGITIEHLLAISNGLHIPVRRFFFTDCGDIKIDRNEYTVSPFMRCHYENAGFQELVNTRSDVTWSKAARATGMSYQHLQKSLLAESRLPVNRFLAVCRAFEVNPFTILIDPNPETTNSSSGLLTSRDAEIVALRKQVEELSLTVAELKAKVHS